MVTEKETEKVKENGSQYGSSVIDNAPDEPVLRAIPPKTEKPNVQKCADEINEILKKYNCTMVCNPTYMYGRQKVWVPGIVEIKK